MSERLPVIAAIPNYNMAPSLNVLLPQLINHGYDAIYVLDDASNDHSRDVVASYERDVVYIGGQENQGAGANRNKVIDVLNHNALLHFIDADCEIRCSNIVEKARVALDDKKVGFVGGLVLNEVGKQSIWNYGPRQGVRTDLAAPIQSIVGSKMRDDFEAAARLRQRFESLLCNWPNPFEAATKRQVFWAIESNLLVHSDLFARVGGFDPTLREHEIQDLAIRLEKLSIPRVFDPTVVVKQKQVDVRGYNRLFAQLRAEWRINRKHGLRNWLHNPPEVQL